MELRGRRCVCCVCRAYDVVRVCAGDSKWASIGPVFCTLRVLVDLYMSLFVFFVGLCCRVVVTWLLGIEHINLCAQSV